MGWADNEKKRLSEEARSLWPSLTKQADREERAMAWMDDPSLTATDEKAGKITLPIRLLQPLQAGQAGWDEEGNPVTQEEIYARAEASTRWARPSWPETPMLSDRRYLRALRLVAALGLLILPGTTNDIGHITAAGMVFLGLCCLREL